MSLDRAMRLLEAEEFTSAETAFAERSGPGPEGVIARFRRAECLSRLGRHEEAIVEARQAREDDPDHPPAAVWLARVLAEAGRFEEAGQVEIPGLLPGEDERLSQAFLALADLAANRRDDVEGTIERILAGRHSPVLSLALRLAETHRAHCADRGPDPGTLLLTLDALDALETKGGRAHPDVPRPDGVLADGRQEPTLVGDPGLANRFVRLLRVCDDFADAVARVVDHWRTFHDADEAEFESRLREDDRTGAEAVLDRVAADTAPESLSGDYALRRTRLEQLEGRPTVVDDHPGGEDARRQHPDDSLWLDVFAAALREDLEPVVGAADRLARPDAPYAVQIALAHWALPRHDTGPHAEPEPAGGLSE